MKRPSPLRKMLKRPEIKEIVKDFMKDDHEPSPWLRALNLAHQCEAQFDWEGAEKAYIQACGAENSAGLRAMGFIKLSAFYSLQGRDELALDAVSKAVEVGDNIALNQALHHKALLCLAADRIEEAEQLTTRLLGDATDTEMDLMHYFGLLIRAQIAIKKGQLEAAQADLKTVWEHIEPWDGEFMAGGYQSAFGSWWGITANMHAANGDSTAAIDARREEVKRRRIVAQLPQIEGIGKQNGLARSLWQLGKQLEEANDAGARHAFSECRSIRESIGLSGDFS